MIFRPVSFLKEPDRGHEPDTKKGKDECFRSNFQLIDRRIYGNTEILFLKF